MNTWTRTDSPHILRALDSLFSQLGGNPDLDADLAPEAIPLGQASSAAGPVALGEIQPPPKVETQADLQAAYDWLLRERKRLEAYTNAQFGRLQQDHAALVTQHYTNEQVMLLRTQELASKEEFLTRQTRSLQEQARHQAEREKALTDQREQLCRVHEEYAVLQESCTGVQRDAQLQHALLETLRAETKAIQADREKARLDLDSMENRLQEQRVLRDQEQALLARRQTELDQRIKIIEQTEQATQRRLAELDDLEARLRHEIEDQEKQLAAERKSVEALAARLRQLNRIEENPRKELLTQH
jgi:hypothetical protein